MQRRNKEALIGLGFVIVGAILLLIAQNSKRPLAEAIEKQHPNYEEPAEK